MEAVGALVLVNAAVAVWEPFELVLVKALLGTLVLDCCPPPRVSQSCVGLNGNPVIYH